MAINLAVVVFVLRVSCWLYEAENLTVCVTRIPVICVANLAMVADILLIYLTVRLAGFMLQVFGW